MFCHFFVPLVPQTNLAYIKQKAGNHLKVGIKITHDLLKKIKMSLESAIYFASNKPDPSWKTCHDMSPKFTDETDPFKLSLLSWCFYKLTLLMLEMDYCGLFDQYHAWWCPGNLRSQGISKHGSRGQSTSRVAALWMWSSSVVQNPRYDTILEYIFHNL